MAKTITLRLDDATYRLFHDYAQSDNRPIANMIETAAKRHLEECSFADEAEMAALLNNPPLVRKLKRGSTAAKKRSGRFVD